MSKGNPLAGIIDRAVSYAWFLLLASHRLHARRHGAEVTVAFHSESHAIEFQKLVQRSKRRRPINSPIRARSPSPRSTSNSREGGRGLQGESGRGSYSSEATGR